MHFIEPPQGYTARFQAHQDPVIQPVQAKMMTAKQEHTLMGDCLKGFIKERLYGNCMHYVRKQSHKKQRSSNSQYNSLNTHSRQSSLLHQQSLRSSPLIQETRQEVKLIQHSRKTLQNRQDLLENRQRFLKQRQRYRYSLAGNPEQSMLSSIRKNNYTALGKLEANSKTERQDTQQDEQYKANHSFISAIQETTAKSAVKTIKEDMSRPEGRSNRKREQLSPLQSKLDQLKKMQNISNTTLGRSALSKDATKFTISPFFWEQFCKPFQFTSTPLLAQVSQTQLQSLPNSSKLQSVISKSSLDKSKYFSGKCFLKESLLQHLLNNKHANSILGQFGYSFFELGKVTDDMKQEQYRRMVQVMVAASGRVWAVMGFRFWDIGLDGAICSKDIFKMYQKLDLIQLKIKQEFGENYKNLQGYRMACRLKQNLQEMRLLITRIKLQDSLVQKKTLNGNEIDYLEQALLRRTELRYSDLLLVMGNNIKITTKDVKHSVIETQKEPTIKFSSCYRYSFLATDHNEQTRLDRQQIETLKEKLRNEKSQSSITQQQDGSQKGRLPSINYQMFLQKRLYLPLKELLLQIFGINLQ